MNLSKSELAVLVAVTASWRVRNCAPTLAEIKRMTGVASPGVVRDRLRSRGLIRISYEGRTPLLATTRPTPRALDWLDEISPPLLSAAE